MVVVHALEPDNAFKERCAKRKRPSASLVVENSPPP